MESFKRQNALLVSLGFLFFAIGGSRGYNRDVDHEESTDWDLFGILRSKRHIVSIMTNHLDEIYSLLGIVKPEFLGPWEVSEAEAEWDIIRVAGFAKDGSKRSLKMCSHDCLQEAAQGQSTHRFNVLSAKIVRKTGLYHPIHGYSLIVFQPSTYMRSLSSGKKLVLLYDADFLHPEDQPRLVSPGVTLDLLFTSEALFEEGDVTHLLKQSLLRKWQRLSESKPHIKMFYRHHSFDSQSSQELTTFFSQVLGTLSEPKISKLSKGYASVTFIPSSQRVPPIGHPVSEAEFCVTQYDKPERFRRTSGNQSSPFSSNSEGCQGEVLVSGGWRSVFRKTAGGFLDEISALPNVLRYWPHRYIQKLVAVDKEAKQLFFALFPGKTLNERRLDYYRGSSFLNNVDPRHVFDWFINIELLWAEHVWDVYSTTIQQPSQGIGASQPIHRFYNDRLASDHRFHEFYTSEFFRDLGLSDASSFLNTGVNINGRTYPALSTYLARARQLLSRENGLLEEIPVAFGLGDGHGGNLMTTEAGAHGPLLFIDYEASGYHSPLLDIAKPIYLDGFFNILYADLLTGDLAGSTMVTHAVSPEAIRIDYQLSIDPLGKALAKAKLEYGMKPIMELLSRFSRKKVTEEVLAYALFSCALLTRNFRANPDGLFLNMAIGIKLADNMWQVFSELFDWGRVCRAVK
ncbi:hypothetical protein DL769_006323 [Monosporascus sp. CRB-8-3]|nr:hypothetical protein DL769_006323 [Monosporascus sp. CRB-8-3]